ncbi:hypothetical protein D3C87_1680370 [compost metagenome]
MLGEKGPSTSKQSKHSQAISISIPISISSSSKKTTADFFSNKGIGPLGPFANSKLLASAFASFPHAVQNVWLEYWPDQPGALTSSLEKALMLFAAGDMPKPELLPTALTKWLWREKNLRRPMQAPLPGKVVEENYEVFEALLKTHGVESLVDVLNLKEGA